MSSSKLLMLLSLTVALAPCAQAAPHEIRWVLAHEPSGVFTQAAQEFADLVSKETNGDVVVKIISSREFGHGKLANPDEVAQLVADGKVEMTQTYTTSLGRFAPKLMVLDMPYLFRDHVHAAAVLDGAIGKDLLASLSPRNMKGLAFTYSGGYRIVPTTEKEIHKPSDMKGLRVRTSNSPVAQATIRVLGGVPVPASMYALHSLAKAGKVDATESTLPRYADDNDESIMPVINETNHSLFLTAVMINEKFYNALPKADQEAVSRAALQMAQSERRHSVDDGQQVKKDALAKGQKYVVLTPAEQAEFVAALKPVRDEFTPRFGDLVERIEKTR
jgi:tripartite ATP-independent transporter DctP family solute receptor